MQVDVSIRPAELSDVPEICAAAVEFFNESSFRRLNIRVDKYRRLIEGHINNPYCQSIIARVNSELVGYIHIYCHDDYTDELIGELYQFYVRKQYRGTGVARCLVDAACKQWRDWGCVRAYSDANPGFDDNGKSVILFRNLWGKFGFSPTGQSFMREF